MPPVEFQVDSLDTVEEAIRPAYVEREGKFHFDADKYSDIKATGLKNKNKELLGKLNQSKEAAKRFEKFAELDDSDLEELLELRANKDSLNDKGKEPSAADAERLAQLEKQHKKALDKVTSDKTTLETQFNEAQKELKHFKLTVPIRDAALKAGVIPEDIELVLLDTQKRFQLSDEGKVVVVDEDGDPLEITPEKFFTSLYKEMRPKFYAASGAGGSGAPSNTSSGSGGSKVITRAQWEKMSPAESAKYFAEGGKIKD